MLSARLALATIALAGALAYPVAYRGDDKTVIFGTVVPDPYRWMENVDSERTRAWSTSEDTLTRSYLSALPLRDALRERLTSLWSYRRTPPTSVYGSLYVRRGLTGSPQRPALLARDGISGRERVVLDSREPNVEGSVSLDSASFSRDGRFVAFSTADGSTSTVWHVRDVRTLALLGDRVRSDAVSRATWTADGRGFFYETTETANDEKRVIVRVVFHRLYDGAARDRIAFTFPTVPHSTIDTMVTRDGSWVVLTAATYGRQLTPRVFIGRTLAANEPMRELFVGRPASRAVIDSLHGALLFAMAGDACPDGCIERIDPSNPARDTIFLPDDGKKIQAEALVGQSLFALYSVDAHSEIAQYDDMGKRVRTLSLPAIGTIDSDAFRDDGTGRYLSVLFSSYTIAPTLLAFDAQTGERSLIASTRVHYDPNDFETEQRFFSSADGTRVPMFVTHLRSLTLDNANPAILYVYGGFGLSQEPVWTPEIVTWLSIGGVYAVVNARGGSEYGEAWHRAGSRMNKQRTIDDVIGAARELAREKFADSAHLALRGDSNGGFVAANAALQHPELFKALITREGLLDLLRYDDLIHGDYYQDEYGLKTSSAAEFENMLRLSPVDQVNSEVAYPAALIQTGDADEIVSPAHSFKFAATLQADPSQRQPVLLRIDHGVGHDGGEPLRLVIDESVDQYSFLLDRMGVSQLHSR